MITLRLPGLAYYAHPHPCIQQAGGSLLCTAAFLIHTSTDRWFYCRITTRQAAPVNMSPERSQVFLRLSKNSQGIKDVRITLCALDLKRAAELANDQSQA